MSARPSRSTSKRVQQHPALEQGKRPLPLDQFVAVTLDDILTRLDSIEGVLRSHRPIGRLYGWEFTLFGGKETVTQVEYDPDQGVYNTTPLIGSGKNLVVMNFTTGYSSGRSTSDTITPFNFPRRPLFALQIINEIPSGASSGADIRIGLNNPSGDYSTPILIRSNDSYSTGVQEFPTFRRLVAVNAQPTNTTVDSYVRVVGMI